ncbi:MAG: diaminopimelate decarboxylase [Osedax symbiont Rs2]|nr:MAG: diaminopimelate decarboxylase [Osedax symbiont Rs2]
MQHIRYQNSVMQVEGISVSDLASRYPTPFYCYSANAFRQQYRRFADAFADFPALICYALKVNSNQAILKILADEGAGADVVSQGELLRALAAGISADKIVFSGVAKTSTEIAFALECGIHCFNIESESELQQISQVAVQVQRTASISLRINPDIDAGTHAKISTGKSENKFGIPWKLALQTYQLAASLPGIKITGIDMHIGSQISKISAFDQSIARLVDLIAQLRELDINIQHIDFGGGLAISYTDQDIDEQTLLAEYAAVISRYASALNCQLIFEPGRFIAGNAGILVTKVIYVKPVEQKTFLIVDAAMNDLIRPTLYDAWHQVATVIEPAEYAATTTVDIVGPVCETGDYLALDRSMPKVAAGELLVLHSAGAYGAVASSTYNSRPLIAEVLVDADREHLIRPSPTHQQIIDLDSVPDWL